MPTFSQRFGFEPLEKPIQDANLDKRTKNRLWNYCSEIIDQWVTNDPHEAIFAKQFYDKFLGERITTMPHDTYSFKANVERQFDDAPPNRIYELLEFIAKFLSVLDEPIRELNGRGEKLTGAETYTAWCNAILASERSAYRFVNVELSKVTDENELEELNTAATSTSGDLRPVFSSIFR